MDTSNRDATTSPMRGGGGFAGVIPAVGARVGEFEITRHIATTQLSTVMEGVENTGGRRVALKFMHEPTQPNSDLRKRMVARFRREYETVNELAGHSAIVEAIIFDEKHEPPCAVYEFAGRSVAEILQGNRNGLPVPVALRIAAEAAAALKYAHENGVLHRDIKPGNLMMMDLESPVKMVDFGAAKVQGQQGLTTSSDFLSTRLYCAPEYLGPAQATPQTDIYSLGISLAEMLCGPLGMIPAGDLLPRLAMQPGIYEEVLAAVRRATEQRPEHRFASAADMEAMLRTLIAGDTTSPYSPMPAPQTLGTREVPAHVVRVRMPGIDVYDTFLVELPEVTIVHFSLLNENYRMSPATLGSLSLPDRLLHRRTKGIIFSGKIPLWLAANLASLAHNFAWTGVYVPGKCEAVITYRNVPDGPPVGSVWQTADVDSIVGEWINEGRIEHEP